MRCYCVYIMASRSRVLYAGVTNDIVRRVDEHKRGLIPGFTRKYHVTRLVYCERFTEVRAAIAREKEIHGSLRRSELHKATGLHAGAARSRGPAVQGLAVPAHHRGIDDAGGDPHTVAGDLPAVFGPVVAQRPRAGGKPVRAGLQPLCRTT